MGEELALWIELEGCFNFRGLGGYRTISRRGFHRRQRGALDLLGFL